MFGEEHPLQTDIFVSQATGDTKHILWSKDGLGHWGVTYAAFYMTHHLSFKTLPVSLSCTSQTCMYHLRNSVLEAYGPSRWFWCTLKFGSHMFKHHNWNDSPNDSNMQWSFRTTTLMNKTIPQRLGFRAAAGWSLGCVLTLPLTKTCLVRNKSLQHECRWWITFRREG